MTHDRDRADLVVVGAGVAGLTAAIHAAELGLTVIVTSKGSRRTAGSDTSTRYAQGGIAVVDPAGHVADRDPGLALGERVGDRRPLVRAQPAMRPAVEVDA